MTTLREAAQMALDNLESLVAYIQGGEPDLVMQVPAIEALRTALAAEEPEQCHHRFEVAQEAPLHSCCQICGEVRKQPEPEPVETQYKYIDANGEDYWTNEPWEGKKVEAVRHLYAATPQPEPPCKTGSQCIGGKCMQCAELITERKK